MKLLWLGGTDILSRLGPLLASGQFPFRDKGIVLDVASQGSIGLQAMETHLRRLVGMVDEPELLLEEASKELNYAWLCQGIVVGNATETALLRQLGYGNLVELPYAVASSNEATAGKDDFAQRKGLLFPLSIYQAGDAGHDGFDWFCLSVMPYLRQHFGDDLSIWIGGYHHPLVDLGVYERLAPLNGLAEMGDFTTLLRECRVLIGPSRVLAAQATEILEAAGEGLPAVLSTPQMERLEWQDGQEALDGGFNDPQHFAQQLIRLYEDQTLWADIRKKAQANARQQHSPAILEARFSQLLEGLFGENHAEVSHPARRHQRAAQRILAPAPLHVALGERDGAASEDLAADTGPVGAGSDEEDLDEEEGEDDSTPLPTHLGVTLPKADEEWRGTPDHG